MQKIDDIHIHHFITELAIGGAQMALFRLLKQFQQRGYQLSVSCLYNGDGAVANKIRDLGIEVHDWGMGQQKWRLDAFGRFYAHLAQTKPTILHTWMFHANIPGRVVGRAAGVPLIVSAERTTGQEGSLRHKINRHTARWADGITCVSEQVAVAARRKILLPSNKIIVVPNGIDLSQYESLPSQQEARQMAHLPLEGKLIVAVGRPRPVKGFNYLVDAWPQISAEFPDAKLVFVGDGPDRAKLEAQARQLDSAESVIFMGDRSDIPQLLPAFDLLVLPSLHEGMPNVALEAMAAGLPVVATAVGGTPEVVAHEKTGLLVRSQDPQALADAIQKILVDPELAEALGAAGKKRVNADFSLDSTVRQTELLYQNLLAARFGDTYARVAEAQIERQKV